MNIKSITVTFKDRGLPSGLFSLHPSAKAETIDLVDESGVIYRSYMDDVDEMRLRLKPGDMVDFRLIFSRREIILPPSDPCGECPILSQLGYEQERNDRLKRLDKAIMQLLGDGSEYCFRDALDAVYLLLEERKVLVELRALLAKEKNSE